MMTMHSLRTLAFVSSSLLLLATVALACPGAPGKDMEEKPIQSETLPQEWPRLLQLALEHTEQAKLSLAKKQATTRVEPIRKLAKLLLDEWDLAPTDNRLETPVLVWRPQPDIDSLPPQARTVSSPSVLITVDVTSEGDLENIKLLSSSGNPEVDEICLDAAGKALYRPARSGQTYVTTKAVLQYHLDPR